MTMGMAAGGGGYGGYGEFHGALEQRGMRNSIDTDSEAARAVAERQAGVGGKVIQKGRKVDDDDWGTR